MNDDVIAHQWLVDEMKKRIAYYVEDELRDDTAYPFKFSFFGMVEIVGGIEALQAELTALRKVARAASALEHAMQFTHNAGQAGMVNVFLDEGTAVNRLIQEVFAARAAGYLDTTP